MVEPYPSESEARLTGTCRDCKHWSGKSAAVPTGKGFCNLAKNSKSNAHVQAPGGLITAPEFGCNQYTAK